MTQPPGIRGPRLEDESFLAASLSFVRRCPARSDYIELCFATEQGSWKWCFPEPPKHQERVRGTLAVTVGRYGAQAHIVVDNRLGHTLPSGEALPMILDGSQMYVARRLVEWGVGRLPSRS